MSGYVTIDEDLFPGENTTLRMNDVRRWIGQAKEEGTAAERARIREKVEALGLQVDDLVRVAVAKVESDEIHDFDVAIGRFMLDRVLALLAEPGEERK